MYDLSNISERYVALWNERDPEVRRSAIHALWAADGAQVLADPPMEVRRAAADLRFTTPTLEVRGHEALEARVARAYEMFVEPGDYEFRASSDATELLRNLVTIRWSRVATADGTHVGGGVDVIDLDEDGRIRTDYQFIER